jgi:hypothetical protein
MRARGSSPASRFPGHRLCLSLLLLPTLLAAAACGPKKVQLYQGDALPDQEVAVLYTNPHLDLEIDQDFKLKGDERKKLHKLEMTPGDHALAVSCHYSDDVTYHPPDKAAASPPDGGAPPPPPSEKITQSPVIVLRMDGVGGHAYKLRVHFYRNAQGIPGCRVKVFDLATDPGEQNDLY